MVDRRESNISHTQFTHSSSHFGGYSSSSSNSCPSFSSVLLDEIYRSIDRPEEEMHTITKKSDGHANVRPAYIKSDELGIPANDYYQRACMVEKRMEANKTRKIRHGSSSASSWDSLGGSGGGGGGGGFFSSSEAESFRSQKFGGGGEINTDPEVIISPRDRRGFEDRMGQKSKTKLRALRIYGDLKKMKQPISPGRKLAGFLNSLFTAGNLGLKKKQTGTPTIPGGENSPTLKSTNYPSTSSSASSFSRSCLSGKMPPPPSGKSSGGGRSRKVSFFPMSAISDDEDFPNNNNNVSIMKTAIDEEIMAHMMKKNRRVGEAARDFLVNNYQKKTETEEEEEEEDAASCGSSDLFELDIFGALDNGEIHTRVAGL
ncbi:hypothetical protein MIMGU_mgv1a026119mg [Erythranthe guttata]|uniref:Protein BIG GRAIN 1-like B n=1 Tax=Erythranthe guttata TaxID=4155 RepID=A0A022S3L0_ERYGU|nr:PREDICTED: uncharacterized protein LOC105955882 [Erythranthe guttata]EYU45880.1 hypothetical protein MIMGU_mgv1a026119mg [Erythranthe guttata]|eukprot:XP_012835140.1 PREDICTED: uncharacterized protein LOC105955882 [Erythranthe guttata]